VLSTTDLLSTDNGELRSCSPFLHDCSAVPVHYAPPPPDSIWFCGADASGAAGSAAVRILRREQLPVETKNEFGELAKRELDRLKGIVTRFLDFARPQAPRRLPTDPVELLESVATLAGETAKMAGVTIRVASDANSAQDRPPFTLRITLFDLSAFRGYGLGRVTRAETKA
jgi:hypothetical protein